MRIENLYLRIPEISAIADAVYFEILMSKVRPFNLHLKGQLYIYIVKIVRFRPYI